MKTLFAALLLSSVVGTLAGMPAAEAAASPCNSYGGCEQLDMSPPNPAVEKPAPSQPSENSVPKPATRTPAPLHPEQRSARRQPRDRDWYLHRPSTPQERAETRALNREAAQANDNSDWYSHGPATPQERADSGTPNREAAPSSDNNDRYSERPAAPRQRTETRAPDRDAYQSGGNDNRPAAANHNDDYLRMHQQYQRELRDYRAALRAYEFRTRPRSGSFDHSFAGEEPYRRERPLPPRTNGYRRPPAPPSADQERLDPWHGYYSGPGNGY